MRGAWGLALPDSADVSHLLVPAPADWPLLQVNAAVVSAPSTVNEWGPDRARYRLAGGNHISIEREPALVDLELQASVPAEAVVTPHLSSAASTFAIWRGAEPFHAGSFVHDGGAWVIFGRKGAGKSSTLAALAELGVLVLADDLSIYEGGSIVAGPRALDLRSGPAGHFGLGKDLGIIGSRRRWRIYLPQVPSSIPLHGWLLPEWGQTRPLELIPVAERLRLLPEARALRLPWGDPQMLLELASYPGLRWTRPRGHEQLRTGVNDLLSELSRWPR